MIAPALAALEFSFVVLSVFDVVAVPSLDVVVFVVVVPAAVATTAAVVAAEAIETPKKAAEKAAIPLEQSEKKEKLPPATPKADPTPEPPARDG